MSEPMVCDSCGRSVAPGTPAFGDRRRIDEGRFLCGECARADKAAEPPGAPVSMPNTNFPNTH